MMNLRLIVNLSKTWRKPGPFWSKNADRVCLMPAASKRGVILGYQGCGNKAPQLDSYMKHCHKIHGQGAGKNQNIYPRHFSSSHLNY